jgi:hypothetical protein
MRCLLLGTTILLAFVTFGIAESSSALTRIADGFDFPIGDCDANGYHKSRGFQSGGHPGEDWNGPAGGNSDLGDPVYAIGNGIVVFSRDVRSGWGNVIIVRHAYYDNGKMDYIDSLYAHLEKINVLEGQRVSRRQQIGTIGNNRGMYHAHLHFEIRRNLAIGMNRSAFPRDLQNYRDPTTFIAKRRSLGHANDITEVALNTFKATEAVQYADASPARSSRSRSTSLRRPPGLKLRITATFQEMKVQHFD